MRIGKKAKNKSGKNLKYLIKVLIKDNKSILVLYCLHIMIGSLIPIISVVIPKVILDAVQYNTNIERLEYTLAIIFVIFSIMKFLSSYINGIISKKVMKVRIDFVIKLQRKCLKMNYYHTENPNVLNENINAWRACQGGIKGIENVYNTLVDISPKIVIFIIFLFLIFKIQIYLFIMIITTLIISYIVKFQAKKNEHSNMKDISKLERKCSYFSDSMSDFAFGKEIRIYKLSEFLKKKFNNSVKERIAVENNIQKRFMKCGIMESFLSFFREGIGIFYLGYSVLNNVISIGDFSMYFSITNYIDTLANEIIESIANIRAQDLYINDYISFIEKYEDDIVISNIKNKNKEGMESLEIEFKDVSFKYPHGHKEIFRHLNLKIKPGEKIAIVGLNGAGKSTLIKLLTRLYNSTNGEILINGNNIEDIDKGDYFKLFSVVFQDSKLYAFTIKENIVLTEKYSEDKLVDVLKKSDMYEKINNLPKGINTSVLKYIDDKGVEFSGGETQKLNLARALYKNGKIIILDEPTAALDPIAENKLYQSFDKLTDNKTTIYISHRLASTSFCDKIILLEDGKIIEVGTHDELIKMNGRYAEIFNTQASYYK